MDYGQTLSPLNPLRAFEAAARHLQLFTRAAIELNVTHAAVSQAGQGAGRTTRLCAV
ncbi:LysR family transcriptional regulator [Klebsiella pneumoniae]